MKSPGRGPRGRSCLSRAWSEAGGAGRRFRPPDREGGGSSRGQVSAPLSRVTVAVPGWVSPWRQMGRFMRSRRSGPWTSRPSFRPTLNLTSNTDVGGSRGASQTLSSGQGARSMRPVNAHRPPGHRLRPYRGRDHRPGQAHLQDRQGDRVLDRTAPSRQAGAPPDHGLPPMCTTFQELSTTPAMDENGTIAHASAVTMATATVKTTDAVYNSTTRTFSWTWSPASIVAGSYDFSVVGRSLVGVAAAAAGGRAGRAGRGGRRTPRPSPPGHGGPPPRPLGNRRFAAAAMRERVHRASSTGDR